jgi:hypothetical protein
VVGIGEVRVSVSHPSVPVKMAMGFCIHRLGMGVPMMFVMDVPSATCDV